MMLNNVDVRGATAWDVLRERSIEYRAYGGMVPNPRDDVAGRRPGDVR